MKAEKLPSGNWRVRVYIGRDKNGKAIRQSFTDPDRKRCLMLAAEFQESHRESSNSETLGSLIEAFISVQKTALSPATIRGYTSIKTALESNYHDLYTKEAYRITRNDMQKLVNDLAEHRTPKTISNYLGLISSVLSFNGISFPAPNKPRTIKKDEYFPDDKDIQKICESASGSLKIAVYLAAYGCMRRSEICALIWPTDFIGPNHLKASITKAKVLGLDGEWVVKAPKTKNSRRKVELPQFVVDEIKRQCEPRRKDNNGDPVPVIPITPTGITEDFVKLLKRIGMPQFRFHLLRAYSASVSLGLGVPLPIVEARGGWEHGSQVLQRVYTHVLQSQYDAETKKINAHFDELNRFSGHESGHAVQKTS